MGGGLETGGRVAGDWRGGWGGVGLLPNISEQGCYNLFVKIMKKKTLTPKAPEAQETTEVSETQEAKAVKTETT